MKYGVIVPCRNISGFFSEYISHNYKIINDSNIPIVFIDNKSEDDTVELIKTLSDNIIINDIDGGFAYSINKGIDYLITNYKTDAFLILSADVIINSSLISSCKNTVWKKNWGYLSFTESEFKIGSTLIKEKHPSSASVFMIHKKTLDIVGYYDEEYYMYGEDNDYFIRIKMKNLDFVKSPETFIHKGQGYSKNNKYSNYISSLCYRNYLLVYKKNRLYFKLIIAIFRSLVFVLLGKKIFLIKNQSEEIERFASLKFQLRVRYFYNAIRYLFRKNELIRFN